MVSARGGLYFLQSHVGCSSPRLPTLSCLNRQSALQLAMSGKATLTHQRGGIRLQFSNEHKFPGLMTKGGCVSATGFKVGALYLSNKSLFLPINVAIGAIKISKSMCALVVSHQVTRTGQDTVVEMGERTRRRVQPGLGRKAPSWQRTERKDREWANTCQGPLCGQDCLGSLRAFSFVVNATRKPL